MADSTDHPSVARRAGRRRAKSSRRRRFRLPLTTWLAFSLVAGGCNSSPGDLVTREFVPSALDPSVKNFDEADIVIFGKDTPATRPLVLFMSGTKGRPRNALEFLAFIAGRGYRVIGLEYDDTPAVVQVCHDSSDPGCSGAFRAMRIFGEGGADAPVRNAKSETIVTRLTTLLDTLAKTYPAEGWATYLKDGAPDWSRFVVTGLSQGAGMAAFIAKREKVERVVLFSSPWDFSGPDKTLAPWLSTPSVTPMDRWYAEYHRREKTAELIKRAYAALGIPEDHILVFDRDLDHPGKGPNPFHPSTIRDTGYAPQWGEMFGKAD